MVTSPKPLASPDKRSRTRSPAYPFINLETAIKRGKEFYTKEGRGAGYLKVAVKHWGYEEKSSGGLQTAAALMSFGLMRDEGTGEKRKLQLTPIALRIILDQRPDSADRTEAIKQAALAPKIHQELWKKFGPSTSNEQLRHALILDWEPPFNEKYVDGFIKEYRDTIAFAKLSESDKVPSEVEDNGDGKGDKAPYVAKVGDYVQWEHDGVLGFPEPKRVNGLSPDGTHAYVDGQYGALPVSELLRESPPASPQTPLDPDRVQRIQSLPKMHMQEFVVPLSDGRAVFQWPSSLTEADVADLKDSLKIVERKIARSAAAPEDQETR